MEQSKKILLEIDGRTDFYSLWDVQMYIRKGKPFSSARRRYEPGKFESSQFLAIMLTGELFETVIHKPFVLEYGTFAYKDKDYTDIKPSSWVIFYLLPQAINDPNLYVQYTNALANHLGSPTVLVDPLQVYNGTHPEHGQVYPIGHVLPVHMVQQLIKPPKNVIIDGLKAYCECPKCQFEWVITK